MKRERKRSLSLCEAALAVGVAKPAHAHPGVQRHPGATEAIEASPSVVCRTFRCTAEGSEARSPSFEVLRLH